MFFRANIALRAMTLLATGNNALLQEVSYIGHENGKDSADDAIPTSNVLAIFPCFDDEMKEPPHAVMKQMVSLN
jgi:hypothetical protein